MSNYSDFLINYFYDLETVLANDGRITLGSPDNIPTISGTGTGYIEQSLTGTITNYDIDRFYYLVSSGTNGVLSSTGSTITWVLPSDVGNYDAVIRSTKTNKTLSDPGYWNVDISNPYKLDPYTSLLCHFNGADNGSVFTDDSYYNHTVSRSGSNVYTTSAYRKLGVSSLYVVGHYLTVPNHDALNMGSGDFTISFWMYPTAVHWNYTVLGKIIQGQGYGQYSIMNRTWSTGWFGFLGRTGSSGPWDIYCGYYSGTTLLNKWSHVEVTRSGSTFRLFIDGIQKAMVTNVSSALETNTESLYIGWQNYDDTTFPGYIDELRISKGIARHTSNFIVYQKEFKSYIDSYTKLLLHMDGNTTSFKDFSSSPKTITAYGNATQTSTQFKFGYKSAYFDGSGDQLITDASVDFGFGSGDFTIDFWIYAPDAQPDVNTSVLQNWTGSTWTSNYWSLHQTHFSYINKWSLHVNNYSPTSAILVSTSASNVSSWTHVAIVRNGSSWKMYVNGTLQASNTWAGSFDSGGSNNIYFGLNGTTAWFKGYLDEVRFSKGIARWTSNFTPPTVAYY